MSFGLFLTTGVVGIGLTVVILANRMGSYMYSQQSQDVLYSEVKAAEISLSEKSFNHILCNGRLYRNNDHQTVVETFTNEVDLNDVEALWLKRAPNATDSIWLRQLFRKKNQKPILHIGHVFRYTDKDRERLKDLVHDGFEMKVWRSVSNNLKPSGYTKCLESYLSLLSNETDSEQIQYTEERMAVISCGEDGVNHILTNGDKMYRSSVGVSNSRSSVGVSNSRSSVGVSNSRSSVGVSNSRSSVSVSNSRSSVGVSNSRSSVSPSNSDKTVVEIFADEVDLNTVDTLWIKKALKLSDSELLQQLFSKKINKPILFIGHIHKYTSEDRQGLKNLITNGFEVKVWETVSNNIKPKYTGCLHQYLELLEREVLSYPDREPSDYTEDKVAVISCGEDRVTHLLTDEGKMYRNSYALRQHAEVVLASTKEANARDITRMWIKNSPCSKCTKVLSKFFVNTVHKPVIYVGSIYEPDDKEDRDGLLSLLREGFRIEVWNTMNAFLYGEKNDLSEIYLGRLREEVRRKEYCTLL